MRPLFDSPCLAKLDSLSSWATRPKLGDDDAIAIADCEALSRVTWLDLRDNSIGDRGVRALAASPYMANKVVLDLRGNPADPGEYVSYDSMGTIAHAALPQLAIDIERDPGRAVPWFRRAFETLLPDRYHAKWAGRPARRAPPREPP